MIPNPLADVLKRHCNVNAFVKNWPQHLSDELNSYENPLQAQNFKNQLFKIITEKSIDTQEYEHLTGEDVDSQEDLLIWLKQLWRLLYGVSESP